MNKIITKKCIICGENFEYKTCGMRGAHLIFKSYRSRKSITCSKKCSRIYQRIRNYLRPKLIRELEISK